MKTLKTIALTCTLALGAFTAKAGTAPGSAANKNFLETVKKEISCPDFLKNKTQRVEVRISFTIDNGKAVVTEINTGNEELKRYVKRKLEQMKFDSAETSPVTHTLNLVFILL